MIRKILLTVAFVLFSVSAFSQRRASITTVATPNEVATNFWRADTEVYIQSEDLWYRLTSDWAISANLNTVTKVPTEPFLDNIDFQNSIITQQNDPPVSPTEGDRYLTGAAATAAWLSNPNQLTESRNSVWIFIANTEGVIVHDETLNAFRYYDGAAWQTDIAVTAANDEMFVSDNGILKGEPNLIYDAAANNLTIGAHTLTNTNFNDSFIQGAGNDYLGTGEIRDPFVVGINHTLNAATGSIRWAVIMGEQNDFLATSTGVINNSLAIGFDNNITNNTAGNGSFGSYIISAAGNINDSGIARILSGGTGNTIQQSANSSGIYSGESNTIPLSASHSAIVGGQSIAPTTGFTHTVFMPKVRIGQGTSATIATGSANDNILTLNGTTGEIEQIANNTIQSIEISLSSAQLLAINTTPIEAIPAPGAGKAILLMDEQYFSYTFVTTAYGPNDNLTLLYGAATQIESFTNALNGAVSTITGEVANQLSATATTLIDNQAVNISSLTGDPTLGDGTGKFFIQYRIVDL